MIIKYCSRCFGKPYTNDMSMTECPVCGSVLQAESVEDTACLGRTVLPAKKSDSPMQQNTFDKNNQHPSVPNNPFGGNGFSYGTQNNDPFNMMLNTGDSSAFKPITQSDSSIDMPWDNQPKGKADKTLGEESFNQNTIRGKVAQYSSSGTEDGEYRRFLPQKIYQAIVYRQRLEDVLHRFTVRVDRGEDSLGYQQYNDIPVNVHGTIAGGLQIIDNAEVQVSGKYRDGVLMADEIYIINNGYKSKVSFQRSVRAIVYGVLSAIMFLFVCFVAATSDGNFFANIKEFCTVWFVITAILTVLYLITRLTPIGILSRMYSKKKPTFPIFVIILISLALAFLFVSAFGSFTGFGSYLSGWIYSIVPIVIIVIALFFVIKSIF